MRCLFCGSAIATGGQDWRKRVEYRRDPQTGALRVYGHNMPDGPLDRAAGKLVAAAHSKHYWADVKRRALRDADAGQQEHPAEEQGEGHRDNRGTGAAGR